MLVGCDEMSLYQSLTILSATKRHCYIRASLQRHAYHYRVICIRDVTYLVRDTGIVEFLLRAFNNYFLHNGWINCIHSKIQISPGMYTTR